MNSKELQEEFLKYEAQDAERVMNNLKITNPMFYQFLGTVIEKARKYDELVEAEEYSMCSKCRRKIDCECMECHDCYPEATCETCGGCHIDGWEAGACWSMENDPDYDPFDI